jgi:hypothetical protein
MRRSYNFVLIILLILTGCASKIELKSLHEPIAIGSLNNKDLTQLMAKNEGFLILNVNSEIQNNTIYLVNLETDKKYITPKLIGRYNTLITALPAGKYKWSSIQLNRGYFKSEQSNRNADFEVLPGKINYPGDIDIIIWNRGYESAMIKYVDREDRLPNYVFNLKNIEFHYSFLLESQDI